MNVHLYFRVYKKKRPNCRHRGTFAKTVDIAAGFIVVGIYICCVFFVQFNLISFFDNGSLPLGIATGHPRFRA